MHVWVNICQYVNVCLRNFLCHVSVAADGVCAVFKRGYNSMRAGLSLSCSKT